MGKTSIATKRATDPEGASVLSCDSGSIESIIKDAVKKHGIPLSENDAGIIIRALIRELPA